MTLPEIKVILFTADGITDKPMPTEDDIDALREENAELQDRLEKARAKIRRLIAIEEVHDELHELLYLVMTDGTIHDLDQYLPEQMQSTLASILYQLMNRLVKAEAAIHKTIKRNKHLADGDNCTLHRLVEHVKEFPNQA